LALLLGNILPVPERGQPARHSAGRVSGHLANHLRPIKASRSTPNARGSLRAANYTFTFVGGILVIQGVI
jgi:hypothetical protein